MAELSVVIITRNEEENIRRCLASVKPVAAEVVVVDSGSVDRTAEICREAGCRVFYREFDGYGMQKQFAVDQAKNDWVLSIDADEVLSPGLQQEINTLMNKMTSSPFVGGASSPEPVAWSIPFSLYFMGRILKHGGVGNEYHLRLFNKKGVVLLRFPFTKGLR